MTIEETKELEDEIKEFNRVYPEWTETVCHLGAGIDIIRKYNLKPEYAAQHDQVFYGNWTEEFTKEDLTALFELNWGITDEFGDESFYHFT